MKRRRMTRAGVGAMALVLVVASFEFAAPAVALAAPAVSAAQRQHRVEVAKEALAAYEQRSEGAGHAKRGMDALRRSQHSVRSKIAAAYSVTVTPDTDLAPGQRVSITGAGFTQGLIFFAQCATDPATSALDCDLENRPLTVADNSGNFTVGYNVSRNLHVTSGAVLDCATVAGGCNLIWTNLDAPTETGSNPLAFDPNATIQTTLSANPNSALVHLQSVQVDGSGFPQNDVGFVVQCAAGAAVADCGSTSLALVETDAFGNFSDTITVRRLIAGLNGTIDCAIAACELIAVGASLDFEARTSISFDPNGPLPELPRIMVAPDAGLVHRQSVQVTGGGFDPNDEVLVSQCLEGSFGPFDGCSTPFFFVQADAAGHIDLSFSVRRTMTVDGTKNDCAAVGCVIRASGFASQFEAEAPITFDDTIPPPPSPIVTVQPSTGLVHRQLVTVTGSNFDSDHTHVEECSLDGNGCRSYDTVEIDSDGTFTAQVPVSRVLPNYFDGGQIDCADPATQCELQVFQDDGERANIALSFALGPLPNPPRAKLSPRRTLKDRQAVTIKGEGFFPGDSVYSSECATDVATGDEVACASFVEAEVDDTGRLAIPQRAHRRLRRFQDVESARGVQAAGPTTVDCLDAGIACTFEVNNEFDGTSISIPIRLDRGAPLAPPPMITVSPTLKLRDRQVVTVHGTGFIEGEDVPILECDSNDFEVVLNCRNAGGTTAGANGVFDIPITVRKKIVGQSSVTDCVVTQCFVLAGDPFDDPAYPAAASLVFDRGAPVHSPKIRIEPRRNLVDGQTVRVTGSDFSPYTDVIILECPTGSIGYGECDFEQFFITQADAQGRISTDYTVLANPSFNDGQNCLSGAGCSLFAGSAFDATESTSRAMYFGSQSPNRLHQRMRVAAVRRLTQT